MAVSARLRHIGRDPTGDRKRYLKINLHRALISLSAEVPGRKMARHAQTWQQESLMELDRLQEMTPEKAGRAMGDFLRGLQQAAGEQK